MSYSTYDLNARISNIQASISGITSLIPALRPPANPDELVVVETIVVADAYPLFNNLTTITPTDITITNTAGVSNATLSSNQLSIATNSGVNEVRIRPVDLIFNDTGTTAGAIYELGGVTIDSGSSVNLAELRVADLTFNDNTGANSSYRLDGATISNVGGYFSYLDPSELRFTATISTDQSVLRASNLTLTDGIVTNTLDKNNWSGNINSVNTVANLTHYLGFFDSSGTGNGKPQKTAGLTCNPATNTITATTFSGNSTSSTSAIGVDLTSDNTSGTYFLPFSKTATATGNTLFIDNTTGPLTYNPSVSTLTASVFSGNIIWGNNQNTATFAGTTLTVSGALSGASISVRNSSIVITGGSNTISALTLNNTIANGVYKVGILNNGTNNLTVNTGLGANIRTVYSGGFNIPTLRYGLMTIDVIVINSVINYIVDVVLLTN